MAITTHDDLIAAIRDNDLEALEQQISSGADINTNYKGETLLMYAAQYSRLEFVRCLVEDALVPIDECDLRGWTALMLAVQGTNSGPPTEEAVQVVKYLVSAGANLHHRSATGQTVLHIAARTESVEIFNFLHQSGADVEAHDMLGRTVLHYAADFSYPNMVEFILQKGWIAVDCLDKFGQTPLMLTAGFPRTEKDPVIHSDWMEYDDYCKPINKAMMFLLDAGANPCLRDVLDRTALHRALINEKNFACLLERCPDFPHSVDKKGQTPIMVAVLNYQYYYQVPASVSLLLKAETDPNIEDDDGKTALQMAGENENYTVIKMLITAGAEISHCGKDTLTQILHTVVWGNDEKLVQLILKEGADINGRSNKIDNSNEQEYTHRCMDHHYHCFLSDEVSGGSPIFQARSNEKMTKLLISSGGDVNFKDIYGNTPCMAVTTTGNVEVLEVLLDAGADVTLANNCGVTLLHCMPVTLKYKKKLPLLLKLCERILSAGARVDAVDHNGRTPLHYAACILDWKNKYGATSLFQMMLRAGAPVDTVDINGQTPFHYAVRKQNIECMEKLIDAGANLNAVDIFNTIPITIFSDYNYLKVITVLAKNGIDLTTRDNCGRTTLHQAAELGDAAAVKYLTSKYNFEWGIDNEGNTVLHAASNVGGKNLECMKIILEKNLVLVDIKNAKGQTALSKVVQAPLYQRTTKAHVKALLKAGANPNIVDNEGKTVAHYATSSEEVKVVELLIAAEADISIRDSSGQLPLHCAAKVGCVKLLELLLRVGSQQKGLTIDERDVEGRTALMHAIGNKDAVTFLLKNGADVSTKDQSGKTALQYSVDIGNFSLTKLLWNSGAEFATLPKSSLIKAVHLAVEGDDLKMFEHLISLGLLLSDCWWEPERNGTLLQCASRSSLKMLKYLIKMTQNIDEHDDNGYTALHNAVSSRNVLGVKYLLEANAQVNTRNKHGRTPLMLLTESPDGFIENVEIFHILLEAGADIDIQDKEGLNAYQIACKNRNSDYCQFIDYVKYQKKTVAQLHLSD